MLVLQIAAGVLLAQILAGLLTGLYLGYRKARAERNRSAVQSEREAEFLADFDALIKRGLDNGPDSSEA